MSLSDKHNYKSFTKSPPASLLNCIENNLYHLSGKCRDLVVDNVCSEFHHVNWPSGAIYSPMSP